MFDCVLNTPLEMFSIPSHQEFQKYVRSNYEIFKVTFLSFSTSPQQCVKGTRIWNYSGLYSVQMRENTDHIITPNTYTFHAVQIFKKSL